MQNLDAQMKLLKKELKMKDDKITRLTEHAVMMGTHMDKLKGEVGGENSEKEDEITCTGYILYVCCRIYFSYNTVEFIQWSRAANHWLDFIVHHLSTPISVAVHQSPLYTSIYLHIQAAYLTVQLREANLELDVRTTLCFLR